MQTIEIEQEVDGRWVADMPAIPGVLAYGATEVEARSRVVALARRVIADRTEHGCKGRTTSNDCLGPA
jgi:predicted RNase H-like HicB family nuclease